ncbi:protein phosphatase [Paenibacillus sp. UNCCL117]|uniref:metallophosphoesterase family protein n=1 Tax=unclassified Paenibacillus TaxID=185978 RepID=UPI0008869D66|nr:MULTISPECIES: metallophosphoesterase family protein [unclassified Paenibacillus]SDC20671.1 protein phosphatase [Paenibacillus sp. cl123]SFW18669.1 protein phosphatase [Paenibacillus sp. UNCCL117]
MEKIALISDIHSNMTALEAVLAHIRAAGIRRIVCLGDLVGKGPQPSETVERIRETCEATIQGNWDHGIVRPQDKGSAQWQKDRLSPAQLSFLAELPFSYELWISGHRLRLVHASADSVYHRITRKADKKEKLGFFENTAATGPFPGTEAGPDIVGYGDLHIPFMQTLTAKKQSGLVLFNTGSVGAPYDGLPQASYVTIEGEIGGRSEAPLGLQWVRVPYDMERAVAIAEEANLPELERYRYEQRNGREQ